jgi:hypothetical protein
MTEAELIAQTIANGEAMLGVYDYENLGWRVPPRLYVADIGVK